MVRKLRILGTGLAVCTLLYALLVFGVYKDKTTVSVFTKGLYVYEGLGFGSSNLSDWSVSVREFQNDLPYEDTRKKTISTQRQSDGYSLARRVLNRIHGQKKLHNQRNNNNISTTKQSRVFLKYESRKMRVQLCPIWKVGTTFLKRLFLIHNSNKMNMSNPYDVSFKVDYDEKTKYISNSKDIKRFMFVRDPYQRLASAYVDKVLAPNPVYWGYIGRPAIKYARKNASHQSVKCGHDLTFKEFIAYVVKAMSTKRKEAGIAIDGHFDLMTKQCKPSEINYDFIGKMESFSVDSIEIVRALGMNKTEALLKRNGSEMAALDAIMDTTYQPFDPIFQKMFPGCVTSAEALQRAWAKLQIRGLIGGENLTVSKETAKKLTYTEFSNMAIESRRRSTPEERKRLKQFHFLKLFSTVDRKDLLRLPGIYESDFNTFEYDPRPAELFSSRSQNLTLH